MIFLLKTQLMKNLFLLLQFLLAITPVIGQNTRPASPMSVETKIEKVTVFLKGSHVTRLGKTSVPAGRSALVFKKISPKIDKNSIQVKGDGEFTILSVTHQMNYLEEQVKREEISKLESEKQKKIEEKKLLAATFSIYKQEEAILQKNQSVAGLNNGIVASELMQVVDFQRKRWEFLTMKQLELSGQMAKLDSAIQKFDKQLVALNQQKELATSEIIVNVSAKTQTAASFELSYYVLDAGWFANYDLRVKDVANPIDLSFKANVRQSSGEDWKDVKLTVSSGDPTTNAESQSLAPWHLRFGYQAPPAYQQGQGRGGIAQVSGKVLDETGQPLIGVNIVLKGTSIGTITDLDGSYTLRITPNPAILVFTYVGYETKEVGVNANVINVNLEPSSASLSEVVVTGYGGGADDMYSAPRVKKSRADKTIPVQTVEVYQPTTVNFEIEEPYTIPSDGKTYTVDIKQESVPTFYKYFAAPKLEENAFLTAHVTNWQDLNLMDGEINLFFEGAFLGRSLLDTKSADDTLEISLGVDKSVVVQRKKIKEQSSRQFIGTNKTERRAFEIIVRNNKQQPIQLTVQDQFPISTNKEIDVTDKAAEGAELENETQILTWNLNLKPKEEKKLKMQYSVKYPKREVLQLE